MITRAGSKLGRLARPHRVSTTTIFTSFRTRLLSSLAVLEQRDGKLNQNALRAVTAAQQLGGPVTGIVAGENIQGLAKEISMIQGIQKILVIDNPTYEKVYLF